LTASGTDHYGQFLRYVDQRRLDGTVFYRTMRLDRRAGAGA
jgi:hypothetical protein